MCSEVESIQGPGVSSPPQGDSCSVEESGEHQGSRRPQVSSALLDPSSHGRESCGCPPRLPNPPFPSRNARQPGGRDGTLPPPAAASRRRLPLPPPPAASHCRLPLPPPAAASRCRASRSPKEWEQGWGGPGRAPLPPAGPRPSWGSGGAAVSPRRGPTQGFQGSHLPALGGRWLRGCFRAFGGIFLFSTKPPTFWEVPVCSTCSPGLFNCWWLRSHSVSACHNDTGLPEAHSLCVPHLTAQGGRRQGLPFLGP